MSEQKKTHIRKCEICGKETSQSYKKGNFFIKIMNKRIDNMFKGEKASILIFCSWDCFEKFLSEEK